MITPAVVLFTAGKRTKSSKILRRRLGIYKIPYKEQPPSDRPESSTILLVNNIPYTYDEIKTRDKLWIALHLGPVVRNDLDKVTTTTIPEPEPTDEELEAIIDKKVEELVAKGREGVESYMKSLEGRDAYISFVVAARVQKHYDAHLLKEIGEMIDSMLKQKAKFLDPYMIEDNLDPWWRAFLTAYER